MSDVEIEKAVELHSENGPEGIIALWADGKTTICTFPKEEKIKCYTSEDKTLYYIAQAFYHSLGHAIKPVKVEE